MIFLGVNLSHIASACLMINGKIAIATQEERFTKKKHFTGYPKKSIDYILKFLRKEKLKIDSIAFSSALNSPFNLMFPVFHFFTIQDLQNYYGDHYYGRKIKNLSTDQYIKTLMKDKISYKIPFGF